MKQLDLFGHQPIDLVPKWSKLGIRLWNKVDRTNRFGCWIWTAATDLSGYGVYDGRGAVHRLVYEDRHGTIPEGMIVMHTCDAPGCVNPDHLKVGTHAENVADMVEKGRCLRSGPKFSDDACQQMVIAKANGRKIREITHDFAVSQRHLYRILTGRSRSDLARPKAYPDTRAKRVQLELHGQLGIW